MTAPAPIKVSDKRSSAELAEPPPPLPDKPPTEPAALHDYWRRRYGFMTAYGAPAGISFFIPPLKEWLETGEVTELKSKLAHREKLAGEHNAVTPARARLELKELRAKYHRSPTPELLKEIESFDLEGRKHSYKLAHQSTGVVLRDFEQTKLAPFGNKLRQEKFLPFIEKELAHAEQTEESLAARMRLPYIPSAVVLSLRWTYAKAHFPAEAGRLLEHAKQALNALAK